MKVLVAGWFSFEQMGATAGDIIAKDIVCSWLASANVDYKVAFAPSFQQGVNWATENPDQFSDIIFVCGPFGNGWPVQDFLKHFEGRRFTGINLSMLQNLEEWNPFDILYERDSSRRTNPDLTFIAPPPVVPVVGIILVHKQKEYGKRALHGIAESEIQEFINSNEIASVRIDTVLEKNSGGLKTPMEIEALIAKMDLVITTRLHGTVLALKNGVPVIPIDPIQGGAKILRQVQAIGWPVILNAEDVNQQSLMDAYNYCLSAEGKTKTKQCALSAIAKIEEIKTDFINNFQCVLQS